MYETPKLKRVGQAEDVVLGLEAMGDDMDGSLVLPPFEFAAEEDFDN